MVDGVAGMLNHVDVTEVTMENVTSDWEEKISQNCSIVNPGNSGSEVQLYELFQHDHTHKKFSLLPKFVSDCIPSPSKA